MTTHISSNTTLGRHRDQTEGALAALRIDGTLDDGERRRRITEVIAMANARAVALMQQRRPYEAWPAETPTSVHRGRPPR